MPDVNNVVRNSSGGLVREYAIAVAKSEDVVIAGRCASSCTMYLRVARCIDMDARFTFHGVGGASSLAQKDEWERFIATYYAPDLARWYLSVGRFGLNTMNAIQVSKLNETPIC